jgi:lysozyme family protein
LQKVLTPVPALEIDGEFGPATLAATRAFQEKFHQDIDGRVGEATLRAMEKALAALRGG